jgi:hypothetical protein
MENTDEAGRANDLFAAEIANESRDSNDAETCITHLFADI